MGVMSCLGGGLLSLSVFLVADVINRTRCKYALCINKKENLKKRNKFT